MIGKLALTCSEFNKNIIMNVYLRLMKENESVSVEEITCEVIKEYPDITLDDEVVFDVLFEGMHECMRFDKIFFNSQLLLNEDDEIIREEWGYGRTKRIGENNK